MLGLNFYRFSPKIRRGEIMERENTPQEGLVSFIENPEEELRQKKERVIKEVFGYHILREIEELGITGDKQIYTNEQLPIYFHALSLGETQVVEKIEAGRFEFDVLRGAAKKRYSIDKNGDVKWQIVAPSTDPFAQLEFRKKLRQQDIQPQGTENLYTDPFLVNQILIEGLQKQEDMFRKYEQAIKEVKAIKGLYTPILRYLPEQTELLGSLEKIQATLPHTTNRENLKSSFIKQYVISENGILTELDDIIRRCHKIWNLYAYFFRPKNHLEQPIREVDRPVYENTLIIELLSNPDLVVNPILIQSPTTSKEQIHKVGKFIKDSILNEDKQKQDEITMLVSYKVVEQNITTLERLADHLELDPALIHEYVFGLLRTWLTQLPGMNFINPNGSVESDFKEAIELNSAYFLKNPIQGTHLKNEAITSHNQLLFARKMNLRDLQQLPNQEQQLFFEKILIKKYVEYERYEEFIKKIIAQFDIRYIPTNRCFAIEDKQKNDDEIEGQEHKSWKKEKAELLVKNIISQISEGNEYLVGLLVKQIIEDSFPMYIRKRKLPTTSSLYEKKAKQLYLDLNKQKITEEEAYNKLLGLISSFILVHEHNPESIHLNREQLIRTLLTREKRVAEILGKEGIYIAPQDINEKAEMLIRDFYISTFGEEFIEDPRVFLLKALKKALQSSQAD